MTLDQLEGAADVGLGADVRDAVSRTIVGPHVDLGHMLDAAADAWTPDAGLQRIRALADGFTASACAHLVGVEEAILPMVRRRLPHGRRVVAEYVAHVRELERRLHRLRAGLYGEAHASREPHRTPWPHLREWLVQHEERESIPLDSILATLTAEEAQVLAHRLA